MKKKAFSLIELSIVILVIGIILVGVTQSTRLLAFSRLQTAKTLTKSAPVTSISELSLWLETTLPGNLIGNVNGENPEDEEIITSWINNNPQSVDRTAFSKVADDAPTYAVDGINKIPALLFNRPDAQSLTSNFKLFNNDGRNYTIISVFRGRDLTYSKIDASYPTVLMYRDSNSTRVSIFAAERNSSWPSDAPVMSVDLRINVIANKPVTTVGYQPNTTYIVAAVYNLDANPQEKLYVNSKTPIEIHDASAASTAFLDDANLIIGSNNTTASAGGSFDGYISEVIAYNKSLRAGDIDAIMDYLAKKFNVELN